ncbi:MAG: hypothetical protein PSN46_10270 [Gammaproteobacteria bacterium]|nr:hypothetical protein [Gammaproteobacteria bacterium]
MNLANIVRTSRVPFAPVYQSASIDGLCCPACGTQQENDLQSLQPCKHLACVYDQEACEFTFQSQNFKQRLMSSNIVITDELDAYGLANMGYGDELLALDLTRAGSWSHELFAFDFNAD